MIRVRKKDGSTLSLHDDFAFVEICDSDGKVAVLLIQHSGENVQTIKTEDPEAARYASLFGVEFCKIIKI